MRVRILRSLATRDRAFTPGLVVEVDDKTAKAWIQAGVAEQDKSLEGPPEVKESVSEANNTTADRAGDVVRGKSTSADRRKRRR